MHDSQIVSLFFERNEKALEATEEKYGSYLLKIAYNILESTEDAKECVNDTYLAAWGSIPPKKPQQLSSYLAKIVRRTAIDLFRAKHRKKRGKGEYALSLDELQDCVSDKNSEFQIEENELREAINRFLFSLSEERRNIFVCRYFYLDPIRDIASYFGISESKTKTVLHRTRLELKEYLKKEGYEI